MEDEIAADQLVRAIRNKGSHPAYHDRKLSELARDWPELHSAIMHIVHVRETGKRF